MVFGAEDTAFDVDGFVSQPLSLGVFAFRTERSCEQDHRVQGVRMFRPENPGSGRERLPLQGLRLRKSSLLQNSCTQEIHRCQGLWILPAKYIALKLGC